MARYLFKYIKLITLLFFIASLTEGKLLASPQQEISGIINTYSRVTTIEAADAVIVDDVTGFSNGDTVLVMQMKGVSIITDQSSVFGNWDGYLGQPGDYGVGFYEFIIIEQVETGPNRIIFRNNLAGYDGYDIEGLIQIIRVPSFESATVTAGLECPAWDSISGTGGVLAMIVNKKLELNADIDVSGKGFRGGTVAAMDGTPQLNPDYYYPESSSLAGRKGESPASHRNATNEIISIENYAKGIGRLYSGGGGATGEYSGGGGGAGFGDGGNGFRQRTEGYNASGRGGRIDAADFSTRVLMGSGGGGSGFSGSGTGSGGAAGGGIVLILTDSLLANGHTIRANGDSVTVVASGDGGAGGGGGGGSVVVSARTYAASELTIEARGGAGGNSSEAFGTGGGGGGGLIWLSGDGTQTELSVNVAGGSAGIINYPAGAPQGSAGGAGIIRTNLNLLLNGFLFNSIISSLTQSQTDSICYGQSPNNLLGTEPVGGIEPYIFRWERKTDEETTWSQAPGSGSTRDLTITLQETDTVQYRRVVTDSNTTPVSDTSKAVTIIVQPSITNNLVGYDTIICAGQDPELLISQNGLPGGGNNIYNYRWMDSTEIQNWQTAPGTVTNLDYDPPALSSTTYYSRIISSGMCIDTSNIVTVEVLAPVSNNTIESDQLICHDDLFDDLTGSDPADGDGSYNYQWVSSTDQNNWVTAEGTSDGKDYNPDETSTDFPGDKYYRRIVLSGYLDCCVDTSAQVLLTSLPSIGNNNIFADQVICQDSIPAPLLGDEPEGGDGINYGYIWEDSTLLQSWTPIAGANQADYNPPALTDTTWYRRIVTSSVCDDTSNVVVINAHPAILNNNISTLSGLVDTTICLGQVPGNLIGETPGGGDGSYLYEWEYSTDQLIWNTAPGTNNLAGYNPPALLENTWYRRKVLSGECALVSNLISITVLPLITDNSISSDQMTCYNTQPEIITGSNPLGGDGSYSYLWEESTDNVGWSAATGNNSGIDYQPPALTGETYYRRTVFSGLSDCCQDISNVVLVGINPLPEGVITAALDTICAGSEISIALNLTGAGPWTVVLNDATDNLPPFEVTASPYEFNHSPVYSSSYTFASITDNNTCEAVSISGSRSVVVYQVPVADAGNDDEVCGLDYTLQANPDTGDGLWLNFSGAIDNITDAGDPSASLGVNAYGTHTFWWKETNWNCVDSASVDISFWEPPSPAYAGEDVQLKPYQFTYTLEAGEAEVGTGTWSVIQSQGSPVFDDYNFAGTMVRGLFYGDNILEWKIVSRENVCPTETDRVTLSVSSVLVPEGFSPNGDAYNQTFYIEGLEYTDNELIITNMAGAVVYRTTNYYNDWEGTNMDGNPLPEGTYYYFLTIKAPLQEKRSGYIIIKR
ncbi:MAG: gliding motility-associated C-terminal domain-containing protein [Bacteroidales bacterium]|nr:gliding motility-associated C-terminal domain-containing protein [Bacteroidales bacterium]